MACTRLLSSSIVIHDLIISIDVSKYIDDFFLADHFYCGSISVDLCPLIFGS